MTTPAAAIDFRALLKDVPKGAWAAISNDEQKVLAYSADMKEAVEKAKSLGEKDPIIVRVPELTSALIL